MPVTGPEVIPCPDDPDWECVRIGSNAYGDFPATPPPDSPEGLELSESSGDDRSGARTASVTPSVRCPEGYVPRPRRRPTLEFRGKRVVRQQQPERNPNGPHQAGS